MGAIPKKDAVANNCNNRIKPTLLRDVKTEALLVFARTALERYFKELDLSTKEGASENDEDASYVYKTLEKLLKQLQEHVVNVDYLIYITQSAKQYPAFSPLLKKEEPLIDYYDKMAQTVRAHFKDGPVYLPVFLVVSVLAEWILGEERSTHIYPFLNEIDFLELIGKFEDKREYYHHDDECKLSELHELSFKVIDKLKNHKYKVNKNRVSKTRNKTRRR